MKKTTATINPNFTRAAASRWCRQNAVTYRDDCGDVNHTALAEMCAAHFDMNGVGGPLDDPDHWIWEVALVD